MDVWNKESKKYDILNIPSYVIVDANVDIQNLDVSKYPLYYITNHVVFALGHIRSTGGVKVTDCEYYK